jgi:hypothetical protein
MFAPPITKTKTKAAELKRATSVPQWPIQSTVDQVHMLQRTIGNQAMLRLLGQHASVARSNEPGASENAAPLSDSVQAKLKVGAVNDPLEHEADRVTDQVMRMPAPEVALTSAPPQISRKCAECEGEEKLQKRSSGTAESVGTQATPAGVPPSVALDLDKSGQPLDSLTREFMESRFGYDFSKVRLHTGEVAAASTREMRARAYTVGRDVVLGEGRYAPSTNEGKQLLAHELAHVVQQSRGGVAPPMAPGAAHETDAARAAAAAVGGRAPVQVSVATGVGLACDKDPELEKALEGLQEQEGPSQPGQPAEPSAQKALTPNELIDEHVFGPRVHEEVGDLHRRLANREARLKTNPTDKALQAEVGEMRARLRTLEGRGLDPGARGTNVPGVGNINTRAAIQVIGPDGKIIALERGSWGPSQHAEGNALAKLRIRLGTKKLPAGTRIMVAGNQVVCGEVCKPDIARFAKDYGVPLKNVSTSVRTRPKIVGQGQASGKTTERTGLRGDVPKATVKTEPLFPGGKEPPAQPAPPPKAPAKAPLPKAAPPKAPPTSSVEEPSIDVPTVKPRPALSPTPTPAPVVEPTPPVVVTPPVRPTSRWMAGLKAGGKALVVALIFAGLDYLVHRQLEKELEKSIDKARDGAMPWAQRLKREDPWDPVYMRVMVSSEDYSRYVPLLGWLPETPKLHMIQMAMVREEIDPPVVEVQDDRLNFWRPGVATTVTYTELMVP